MSRYAADTSVSVSNSKAEIERIIERYGATGFMSGWTAQQAMIAFAMNDRQIRFVLPMPDKSEHRFTHSSRGLRAPETVQKEWEQACRQRWRALALVIKAKLEAVESGISVFDDEFMANIVLPNGRTVSEEVRPRITTAYESGAMPPLLPDYSS
jgi:hypothetical protein